jgi:hypothetical protein
VVAAVAEAVAAAPPDDPVLARKFLNIREERAPTGALFSF